MRVKIFLFSIIVASLIFSGYATATTVALDQTRPDMVLKIRNLSSSGKIYKGNTSELPLELLAAKASAFSTKIVVKGNPALSYLNDTTIHAEGTVNGTKTTKVKWFKTFIQNDSYIEDIPVDKKFRRIGGDSDVKSFNLDVNRSYSADYTFDELDAIVNVTKRTLKNGVITAFIYRTGFLSSVDLNETSGKIFRFNINLKIAFFVTATKKLIGVYQSEDRGFGNIIPAGAVDYFKTHKFPYRGEEAAKGRELLKDRNKTRIDWISLGRNDTLGLDMYLGLFSFKRSEIALIWDPTVATSISLLALDDGNEELVDQTAGDNNFDVFDVDNLYNLDEEIVDQVGEDSDVDLNNLATATDTVSDTTGATSSDTTSVTDEQSTVDNKAMFFGQSIALIAIGVIALRRIKKSL